MSGQPGWNLYNVDFGLHSVPYPDRRLLVVAGEEVVLAQRRAEAGPGPAALPAKPYSELLQSYAKAREHGLRVMLITRAEAATLAFPVGHPRDGILYVGHPADPRSYVPMAEFHHTLFEQKVAEAMRLLTSLGATGIEVEHVSGWESTAEVGAPLPKSRRKPRQPRADAGRRVIARLSLQPSRPPELPGGLVWLAHEPMWQEVARARLESGLESFAIDVRYTDDFGVDDDLKAAVRRAGIGLGGRFARPEVTVWHLRGAFGGAVDRAEDPALAEVAR